MSQDPNRLFDEFAKLMTDASGAAQSLGREVETAFRAQAERFANEMGVVNRESHDAVHDMARAALERIDALEARVSALEKKLARQSTGRSPAKKASPKNSRRAD